MKKKNNLKSGKYNKTGKYFNYAENVFILASAGSVSVSAFALLVCVPVFIKSL